MEIPATQAGRIARSLVKAGDKVSQGTLLATAVSGAAPAVAAPAATAPPVANQQLASTSQQPAVPPAAPVQPVAIAGGPAVHASPSIRRFARELGVPLSAVRGSGPTDESPAKTCRILSNVRSGRSRRGRRMLFVAPLAKLDFARSARPKKPLTRIQRISGPALHRNWITIPHVTNNDEADITELEAFRQKLTPSIPTPNHNPRVPDQSVRRGAGEFPDFNSSLDGEHLISRTTTMSVSPPTRRAGCSSPSLKRRPQRAFSLSRPRRSRLAAKARDGKLPLRPIWPAARSSSPQLGRYRRHLFRQSFNAPRWRSWARSRGGRRVPFGTARNSSRGSIHRSAASPSYDHRKSYRRAPPPRVPTRTS